MSNATSLPSRFLGSMLGTAVGDAIGELAFSHRREEDLRAAVARAGRLVYTDDTAMAIGLAESLVEVGGLDAQHLGDTFKANYQCEPWRGYASGPPTIFARVERRGLAYTEVARGLFGGQGSFGNGAAMRIAPVGLVYHDDLALYDRVRVSASVTHAHPLGVDGAAVLARAIAQGVELDPGQAPFAVDAFCRTLVDFARTEEMRAKMEQVAALLWEGVSPRQAATRLGKSVAAHKSVPFAIYAFLRTPASFEECLLCAILNGGDRDTMGAMAGAISGAYLGVEAIPEAWRARIENAAYIEDLALKLVQVSGARSP